MKSAFVLYTFLLLLEGTLAWMLTGQGFLLAAASCGLLVYFSLRNSPRPVTEGLRLLTAAALAIAGPLNYQMTLGALLLCFIAVPHFLAATQALSEQRADASTHGNPRTRSLVFTIAFYAAMGMVFLLARGLEPDLSRGPTYTLAVIVLLVGLAAWQASRITRLRPALPASSPPLQRWMLPVMLLALTALIYIGPLPWAADLICRLSPRWRMDPVEFKNKPPKPPTTAPASRTPDDAATRLGVDESSVTGEHRLPPRSNLQSSEAARFFIQTNPPEQAAALLAAGPVYLRSHTLNRYSDNKWTPEVSGGVWQEDASDGVVDQIITLAKAPPVPLVDHEVFALEADGYTLPALSGLFQIHLPRVYVVPGDVLQTEATGDIRYRAVSAPVNILQLPNPLMLSAGIPEDRVHLAKAGGQLSFQLQRLTNSVFKDATLLNDRLAALRSFFQQHYTYSTVMNNPNNLGALENFLFDERKGHCDFFASGAALLLREAGVPTRVAYGFASQEGGTDNKIIIVRDRHAHAWTEVYIKDFGWTICDFTPPSNIGQPDPDALPPPPPPQPDLTNFTPAAKEAAPPPPTVAEAPKTRFFAQFLTWLQQQRWLGPALRQLPWMLLGLAVLYAVFRFFRRKPEDAAAAAAKARAALDQQPPYFMEFLRLSAAAGHPKPEGDTPWEHYINLKAAGLPVPPLRPLIEYHCATRYEDAPPDASQEKEFTPALQAFAQSIAPAR